MKLIILTGAPASGKSSIALELSRKTGIKSVSKDDCKIALFEKYGFSSHARKKQLSIFGEKILSRLIKCCVDGDKDLIVDNNFKNFDDVKALLLRSNCDLYCVVCSADAEILAERYNNRIKKLERHPALYTLNQYPIIDGVSMFHHWIDKDDVCRIQQNVTEPTFGNRVLVVSTDNIEKEFYLICKRIADFCGLSF